MTPLTHLPESPLCLVSSEMSLVSQARATNETQPKVAKRAMEEAQRREGAGGLKGGRPLIIRLTRWVEG